MYPVPNVLFLPSSIPRECLFFLYFSEFFAPPPSCSSSLAALWCQIWLCMHPMSLISPCTPALCTLHNHPPLEVHLNSPSPRSLFSLTPSFLFFPHAPCSPPPSSSFFFGSNPGHHLFPSSPFYDPEPGKSVGCSHSLCLFFSLPSCHCCSTPLPSLTLYFPSSLSSLYSFHSPCLLLSTLPVVSLGMKEAACCVYVCSLRQSLT